jgi:tetratricopeptide (TPR) repeat protein
LGEAFQDSGQLDQAIRTYEQALSLDSADPEVYYRLSQLCKEEGNAGMTQLYLDLFLEKAGDLPQFEVQIKTAKRMKRELAVK